MLMFALGKTGLYDQDIVCPCPAVHSSHLAQAWAVTSLQGIASEF
jgi:hypothetical protein